MAPGIGKCLAEWMMTGKPGGNATQQTDPKRFVNSNNNKQFLKDRVSEILGKKAI